MNRLHKLFACFSICALTVTTQAGELMPPYLAEQLGLEVAWQRQLNVPAGAQSIVDQQIFVNHDDLREYVEVVGSLETKADGGKGKVAADANAGEAAKDASANNNVLLRIPTDSVGRNGVEIGKAEAERLAKNEIRRLEYRGYKASLTSRTVPKIRLYTLSDDGTLDCRNAENGEPIWMVRVGDRRLGYGQIGVNEKYVSIVNGGNLIRIDTVKGVQVHATPTTSMPLFGAIHSGDYALLPTIRNGVEGYPLYDSARIPFMEIVQGLALSPPSKSPDSTRIAWGTDRGFVYVMESAGEPSVLFRLNTDGIVSGRIAATVGRRFFFASESGQVYGIQATRTGKVLWSKPFGEPFYHAPLVAGDQMFLRSTYGNLYSLSTDSGIMTWTYTVPNVDALIGAFDGQLYVRLLSGGLAIIDMKTGKIIHTANEIQPDRLLVNAQTDRLFFVGRTGSVQCLRPEGASMPSFNEALKGNASSTNETATDPTEEPVGSTPVAPSADPFAGGGADPFAGGGADPFGAADGGGAMADPFGGGGDAMADPFGGGGADDTKDPFSDPFGN